MRKRLTKSRDNIVVSGVLGGIGEYIGIDPTIIRVIYLALSFFTAGFPGIFLYIILSVIIPSANGPYRPNDRTKFYGSQTYYGERQEKRPRKEAEKVDDEDEWSDF